MYDARMAERKAIRRLMRERRRNLDRKTRQAAATSLANRLFSLHRIRTARNLATYLPVQGEISLEPAIEEAWALNIPVYLPCLRGQHLEFRRYTPDARLAPNRFGIPEPANGDRINPRFLDIVLAPLVAFDDNGERLGTGGGFYDRTFAFLGHRKSWRRPDILGVAYEFQRVDALPAAEWDVPLRAAITDVTNRFF